MSNEQISKKIVILKMDDKKEENLVIYNVQK